MTGVIHNVGVKLGSYEGRINMMAIVIDDFDIILDNTFLKRGVLVMHEEKPYFVDDHYVASRLEKGQFLGEWLCPMQLAQGVKKG